MRPDTVTPLLLVGALLLAVAGLALWWGGQRALERGPDAHLASHGDASASTAPPGEDAADLAATLRDRIEVGDGLGDLQVAAADLATARWTVQVRDSLGLKARGRLIGRSSVPGPWRDAPQPVRMFEPLADGASFVALSAGVESLEIEAEGCPRAVVTFGPALPGTGRLELQLRGCGSLRIRLVDAAGQVLRRRRVDARGGVPPEALGDLGSIAYRDFVSATTDDRGGCLLPGLVEGRWSVRVPEHCEWRETAVAAVEVRAGDVTDVDVRVPALAAVDFAGMRLPSRLLPVGSMNGAPCDHVEEWFVEVASQHRVGLYGDALGTARCVVPGPPGAMVEVALVHTGSFDLRSEPIRLVVGAEVEVAPVWRGQ